MEAKALVDRLLRIVVILMSASVLLLPGLPAQASEAGQSADVTKEDDGVASAATVGASVMFALGDAERAQAPIGLRAMFLYPTTPISHVRARAGVPLVHSRNAPISADGKSPDIQISLEHEWGWKFAGFGVGLSYMYMSPFTTDSAQSGFRQAQGVHEVGHAASVVVNVRGGKPNAGFFGRMAWPFPYILYDDEPDNYFMEYSGLGVFGFKNVKFGIGVMGMFKRRDADYVMSGTSRYDYVSGAEYESESDYMYYESTYSEFIAMVPTCRMAALIAGHFVLSATLELGGTIVPRFSDMFGETWKPYAGIDVVYSFGTLQGPNLMDGTF